MPAKLKLDPSATQGYWTHTCGSSYYPGGPAIHEPSCPFGSRNTGYVYHYTKAEVAAAREAQNPTPAQRQILKQEDRSC